ncbi:YpdA family putative bacillithiol disulfide reductase [Chitinophaga sancti]|uniref:Thioredoxin reductase (NADPH) n=1 Tax=Chitinophaga sancti TaxID=1004 RepID=A0A1K1QJE5_9BACT|nr:YpdA family putative bacillithiol disulfide reductase [Chitinophaga sancti]WQD65214.1 YpdA family putative bacillithiol disulfide reductase [Chitinophaga sancti]WQG89162.1 YpdA family putative bacillithiol disulfide reductase [Chitinophaga sancti]SFW59893.1 thioredoxin reductase (NADPH) [Chitinophaga sancti]
MEKYDILIVGAGPIGLACGLAAQKAGLSYLIIEKGCLTNSLYNYPLYMTFFSTSEKLEIGGIPWVSINAKPIRPEALEYYRRVAVANKLHVRLFEKVESITPGYTIKTSKETYTADHVIIATGFYDIPNMLNIPGEDLPKVTHYYKDPHFYATQKVVVIGANNSSVDAALETYRKGADVTMVVREGEIGKRVKYWVKPDIENRIAEGSIKVYYHSNLKAVREREVDIQTPDGMITIQNDYVLALTGYQPNFSFLEMAGIRLSKDEKRHPQYNPETMETNMPGIYLAGVVVGGMDTAIWFIENSRDHADKIIANILRNK